MTNYESLLLKCISEDLKSLANKNLNLEITGLVLIKRIREHAENLNKMIVKSDEDNKIEQDWVEGPYGLQYRVIGDVPLVIDDYYTMTNGNGTMYTIKFDAVKEHDRNG